MGKLSEGTLYEIEHRFRRVNGEYRWLLTRALPLRGEDGRISKWFGTDTDITEQKMTAEKLRAKLEENESQLTQLDATR
ncbi:MAG: PAS domain-containing protein [Deltaproteobacteria bacterium]